LKVEKENLKLIDLIIEAFNKEPMWYNIIKANN
jgi:hypothetical protein